MATSKRRTSATTSESGAYMSQYDQEVEQRLQALESKAHTPCNGGGSAGSERIAALEAKVNTLIALLNNVSAVTEVCPKGEDGVRKISV